MSTLTSYFVVEFLTDDHNTDPVFYYGPAMDLLEWSEFISIIKKEALKQLKKEEKTGISLTPLSLKIKMDKLLKERGFFKHVINVAEIDPSFSSTKVNTKSKSKMFHLSNSSLAVS